MARGITTTESDFWARLQPEGDCLVWTGRLSDTGYARLGWKGKSVRAHRLALMFKLGRPLLPGMEACHTCDNPPCCKPEHLFEGTRRINIADRHAKGGYRLAAYQGETNHSSKLTDDHVRAIRAAAAMGESRRSIAARYPVNHQTVTKIVNRQRWAHVV